MPPTSDNTGQQDHIHNSAARRDCEIGTPATDCPHVNCMLHRLGEGDGRTTWAPTSATGRPNYSPVLTLPLDERLALALAEDCHTELDDTDIANVVAAVLPVARRYGARDEVPRNG